jgi:hypothetical protein
MKFGEDIDFLDDVVDLVFRVFDIDDLDGYGLTSSLIDPISNQPTYPQNVSSLATLNTQTHRRMFSQHLHHVVATNGLELYLPLVDFAEAASP